jgi:hypothetical protein
MDGQSFLPLLAGRSLADWRKTFVYTYYWEYNYPHTPTVYALREDRYKFMFYHGIWDRNELYDLEADPAEQTLTAFATLSKTKDRSTFAQLKISAVAPRSTITESRTLKKFPITCLFSSLR